jgi:hypothetical protein
MCQLADADKLLGAGTLRVVLDHLVSRARAVSLRELRLGFSAYSLGSALRHASAGNTKGVGVAVLQIAHSIF